MKQDEAVERFLALAKEILGVETESIKLIAQILYLKGRDDGSEHILKVYKEHHAK